MLFITVQVNMLKADAFLTIVLILFIISVYILENLCSLFFFFKFSVQCSLGKTDLVALYDR